MTPDKQDPLLPSKGEKGVSVASSVEDAGEETENQRRAFLTIEDNEDDEYNYSNLEKRESLAFLQLVQGRGMTPRPSCASLAWKSSRASFANQGGSMSPNMTSRPSMASLKETMSRVNLELHPEKGSFIAYSMGQSLASIPTIAAKVYIITQVHMKTEAMIPTIAAKVYIITQVRTEAIEQVSCNLKF